MSDALVAFLIFVLLVRWVTQRARLRRVERELAGASRQIAELTRRVWALEAHPEPVRTEVEEPVSIPMVAVAGALTEVATPMATPVETSTPEPAPAPEARIVPEPVRRASEEWEALVGGSVLNTLGALVSVIAIALFLGYSFTRMGPAGRVATGLAVSGTMLGLGVWLESRQRYAMFSRGLTGAGWAGLYFTAYAMGSIPAAHVIHNPGAATGLLLAVGLAMVGHSLRYRSEAATGIAYFSAFAALALAESTPMAVAALVPLAAALLFVAHRMGWRIMATAGLITTYGTLISRGDSGAPLWQAQALFLVFWVLFEAFEILQPNAVIFGANALFFVGLSYAKWHGIVGQEIWPLATGCALLYLGGAVIRGPRYAAALSVSAVLAAMAIGGKATGVWIAAGLGLEAALLVEFGMNQDRKLFRMEGYVAAGLALLALWAEVGNHFEKFADRTVWLPVAVAAVACYGAGWRWGLLSRQVATAIATAQAMLVCWCVLPDVLVAVAWMAVGLALTAFPSLEVQGELVAGAAFGRLFFANFTNAGSTFGVSHRVITVAPVIGSLYWLRKRYFFWAAAIAIAVLLRFELGRVYCVVGWALAALVFLRVGERWQSFGFAGLAFVRSLVTDFQSPESFSGAQGRILTAVFVIAAFYVCEFLASDKARIYYSLLGSILVSSLLFHEVSGSLLTVAWGLQGLLLLAAGFPAKEPVLRWSGLALLLGCILKLFVYDFRNLDTFYRILSFAALGAILMGVSWVYARVRRYL